MELNERFTKSGSTICPTFCPTDAPIVCDDEMHRHALDGDDSSRHSRRRPSQSERQPDEKPQPL